MKSLMTIFTSNNVGAGLCSARQLTKTVEKRTGGAEPLPYNFLERFWEMQGPGFVF